MRGISNPAPTPTALLLAWGRGEQAAFDQLVALVHDELRRIARRHMRHERPGHSLQATALVNEAYVCLIDIRHVQWQNRAHFFAMSARVMRRILVDSARAPESISAGRVLIEAGLGDRPGDWLRVSASVRTDSGSAGRRRHGRGVPGARHQTRPRRRHQNPAAGLHERSLGPFRARDAAAWVRSLDALEAQSLPGTEGADNPIWSPDNRTVAFVADRKLKAIDVSGGSTRTLCEIPPAGSLWGSWSPDGGTIVFALAGGPVLGSRKRRLSDGSGESWRHTGEVRLFPAILPDGQHFVYLSAPSNVAWLGSLDSKEPAVRLLNATSQVEYVAPGYLVFVRRGTLMAQRFDAQHARLAGEAVQIAEGVGGSRLRVSIRDVLERRAGLSQRSAERPHAIDVGRSHRTPAGVAGKPERYRNPEISPDGTGAVMEVVRFPESRAEHLASGIRARRR